MTTSPKPSNDIIVVGGGVLGMSAALCAASKGFSVALLSPLPPVGSSLTEARRVFALNEPAHLLLADLGIWERLQSATAVRAMELYGPAGARMQLNCKKAAVSQLCHTVDENELNAALAQKLAKSKVELYDAKVDFLEQGARSAVVRSGQRSWQAKLVIGADGRNSFVARSAGLAQAATFLDQSAIVGLAHVKAASNTAWQWMNSSSLLALLPSTSGIYGVVWSMPARKARKMLALEHGQLAEQLAAACAKAGELIKLENVQSFELASLMRTPVSGRVALAGDSAHAYHPLAGQGISVGMGDLIELFATISDQEDPGTARLLSRYRRRRQARAQVTRLVTEAIAKVLGPDASIASSLELLMTIGAPLAPVLVRLANAR